MKLYGVLLLLIFAAACKKSNTNDPEPAPGQILFNVSYGTDAAQKMDIYLPAGRTTASTKVLVVIHGGAWALGDKADMNAYIDSMRKRLPNYAFFNINYRLAMAGLNTYPAGNNDVTAAVNFIIANGGQYLVSDKLVLLGVSSGGHFALYESYKNNSATKIKAVISAFGPTDLSNMWDNPAGTPFTTYLGLTNYVGVSKPANAALYTAASPATYVTASSVPTQLFHGTADTLVSVNQSILLRNKLQTAGVPVQYVQYTGENHGWVGVNLTNTFDRITSFLQTYLP